MNDKKQIEEMANILHDLILDTPFNGTDASCEEIAEKLLEKYQPKIPENAVVLSATEPNEHFIDLLVEFDEMSFIPGTTVPNPDEYARDYKRRLIYAFNQSRKETLDEVYAIVWKEKFRAGGQKARLLGAILDLYEPKKSPYETILDEVRKKTAREILQWLIEHTFESCIFETYFREQYGVEIE